MAHHTFKVGDRVQRRTLSNTLLHGVVRTDISSGRNALFLVTWDGIPHSDWWYTDAELQLEQPASTPTAVQQPTPEPVTIAADPKPIPDDYKGLSEPSSQRTVTDNEVRLYGWYNGTSRGGYYR